MPFVTDLELTARGLGPEAQRQARDSGKLRFSRTGAGFTYDAADVDEWLASTRGTQNGRTFTIVRPTVQQARQTAPHASGDPWQTWSALVDDLVSKGAPRNVAIEAVDKMRPGLREQAIASFNAAEQRREQAEAQRIASHRDALQRL